MMNNKTKYSLLIFITVHIYSVNGQQFYIGFGLNNAKFKDYENSSGINTLDLNYPKSLNLLLETGYRSNLYEDFLDWNIGFSYNNYQINTGFISNGVSIPLTYKLTYFSIKPGIYFTIVNQPRIKLQLHTHISHDWLIKGTSTYSNIINNLYSDNTFDKTLITFHRGISAEYAITDSISTYISYNNAGSFKEENKDSVDGEKYSLSTNTFSCGILFNIFNRRSTICHGGF